MKKIKTKIVALFAIVTLMLATCGSVFAATPNEQVIDALKGASVPNDLVGIASNFLKADPATTLTQAQADAIMGNISAAKSAAAAVKGQGNEAMLKAVTPYFTSAASEAGFTATIGNIVNGSVQFTVSAPGKSVSFTISSTGAVTNVAGGAAKTSSAVVTGIGKTAVDNAGFIFAGVLGVVTIATAGFIALKKRTA